LRHGGDKGAPYALQWLAAELHVGSLDALCSLHAAASTAQTQATAAGDAAAAQTWQRRADTVLHAFAAARCAERDYRAALAYLDEVSRAAPSDPAPLAAGALLLLQLGDVGGARSVTAAAAAACDVAGAGCSHAARDAVARNNGMLLFAAKDYAGARATFAALLTERPWDGVAANNAAVAGLYCGDVSAAVQTLEDSLAAHPFSALSETLVMNLCSIYELASADAPAAKRRLAGWLSRIAPEDFDIAGVTRTS